MVSGCPPVRGPAKRLGAIERIALKVASRSRRRVYGYDLERGPAAIKHSETGAPPHLLNHLGQGGAELFGIDGRIHIWFILS